MHVSSPVFSQPSRACTFRALELEPPPTEAEPRESVSLAGRVGTALLGASLGFGAGIASGEILGAAVGAPLGAVAGASAGVAVAGRLRQRPLQSGAVVGALLGAGLGAASSHPVAIAVLTLAGACLPFALWSPTGAR